MLYLSLTALLFLLRYALANSQHSRQQAYYAVLIGLFIFSAFRYEVGCDWAGYYNQYITAAFMDWSLIAERREPIWWATLGWIQGRGLPYPVANIIPNILFFSGMHVLAKRQPDPLGFLVLSFPVLIINMPMSGIRQAAAIGLICFAYSAFIDRRPIRFAIFVVIASGFHSSALIFLLLLPVSMGHYSKARLFAAGFLAIPGAFLLASGESAEVAASRYIDSDVEAFGAIFRLVLLSLSSFYFFYFIQSKWKSSFPRDYPLVSIGAIGMTFSFLILPISSVIGDRIGYYFIPIQAMILSRISYFHFGSNRQLHIMAPYVVLLIFFFVWTQMSGHFQQCYIPYDSWIFGIPAQGF